MTIEYVVANDCFKLRFKDAFTYVRSKCEECGLIKAVWAAVIGKTVRAAAAYEYVSRNRESTLGKQFDVALSKRTIESTTQNKNNSINNINLLKTDKTKLEQYDQSLLIKTNNLESKKSENRAGILMLESQLELEIKSFNELKEKEKEILKYHEQLSNEFDFIYKKKSDLLSKLSNAMGDKLRCNNPTITDLSDIHRPAKLAEQYSDIYTNDWSDVMLAEEDGFNKAKKEKKVMNEEFDSKKIVMCLAGMIKESQKKVKNYFAGKKKEIENKKIDRLKEQLKNNNSNKEIIDNEPDFWKDAEEVIGDDIRKNPNKIDPDVKVIAECLINEKYSEFDFNAVMKYLSKIIKLIIFMELQAPPLVFYWPTEGGKYDKMNFNVYTQVGDVVDYSVWPSLLLHKDGQMLAKGTVQMKDPSAK